MLELGFLQIVQWLLTPVLVLLACAFAYALWMAGVVAVEAWQRRSPGFSLLRGADTLTLDELELQALARMEPLRLLSRVTPMLGLIATMIPLGPALQGVASGQGHAALSVFSGAFAGVVLALTAACLGLVLYSVRRRWLLAELLAVKRARGAPA
jgi:biopolymer transport protein ExbB/TolQ